MWCYNFNKVALNIETLGDSTLPPSHCKNILALMKIAILQSLPFFTLQIICYEIFYAHYLGLLSTQLLNFSANEFFFKYVFRKTGLNPEFQNFLKYI